MSTRTQGAALASLGLALGGCIDPAAEFDDFADRVIDAGETTTPHIDAPVIDEIPDISGEFLWAISPSVAPDGRLQFLATIELTQPGDGAATVNIDLDPLDRDTRDLIPGAETISATDVPVDMTGQFTAELDGPIPGRANEFSGTDLMVETEVMAIIRSEDLFCGEVQGMELNLNLDFDGSRFAANRIPPGTRGDDLPEPSVECPDPMPEVDAGVPDAMPGSDAGPDDAGPDDAAPDGDATADDDGGNGG